AAMEYRRLGRSGLKVSALGFGSWVSFGPQLDVGLAAECMAAAFEGGINFFDNAESYAGGESERIMGAVFERLDWAREDYVVTSKYFWGIHDGVNMRNTLNRKYLLQAVDHSLDRIGLDFLDIVYCHRSDPETPVEETVFAMHDIVASGKALYWGTSEWPRQAITDAVEIAERHHLHKPVVEQPQYNLLTRARFEDRLAPLCEKYGLGLTTWSPLASGILTGKYLDGVPDGSRMSVPGYEWLAAGVSDERNRRVAQAVVDAAKELGCTPAQLGIGWCLLHPQVSSVITGASRPEQVVENLGALDAASLIGSAPEIRARLEAATAE
ncbi:MAG TPA: aldo/keto reductase, partial [Acidimicrobiales bacterium]|nr:aldo/keto reductase [Acidimicrobiales bacterium]